MNLRLGKEEKLYKSEVKKIKIFQKSTCKTNKNHI